MPKQLYKTKIVIWSSFDASLEELSTLLTKAENGESAHVSCNETTLINGPDEDPDWDDNEDFPEE